MNSSPVTKSLLKDHEPGAFEAVQFGKRPIIFSCDHASNRIPESLSDLGLGEEDLQRHIAWDIGAAEVTRQLAERLSATAILNNYSRLVVDCNRYLSDPSAFVVHSDSTEIIGNQNLSELEKAQRAESIYYSYHKKIGSELAAYTTADESPILISVHSFTPKLKAAQDHRPWHVGVLWDKDPRVPLPLLAELKNETTLVVGDNQPYSGRDIADFTVDHHAEKQGFAHTSIEIRQDLIGHASGVDEWSERLAIIFENMFRDPDLFIPRF